MDQQYRSRRKFPVLIEENNLSDRELIKIAFEENSFVNELHFVDNGEEIIDYLNQCDFKKFYWPGLILLDINIPDKDGINTLRLLKAHPKFCRIPVIIITYSDVDVSASYAYGANGYIIKPSTYREFAEKIKILGDFWFTVAESVIPSGLLKQYLIKSY